MFVGTHFTFTHVHTCTCTYMYISVDLISMTIATIFCYSYNYSNTNVHVHVHVAYDIIHTIKLQLHLWLLCLYCIYDICNYYSIKCVNAWMYVYITGAIYM